jgi:hypothetical protein
MTACDTCGNVYDKAFEITKDDKHYTFDSFECAIRKLAPRCKTCGTPIIGHGLEKDGIFYCCDHCAERDGVSMMRDRV